MMIYKKILKALLAACEIIGAIMMLWMLISWADVLLHNTLGSWDGQCMPWNAFVLLERVPWYER